MSDATRQRLLAAIREVPDDDTPRIAYATYVTSQGDPRGEFILLQCRIAAAPVPKVVASTVRVRKSHDLGLDQMRKRETELLAGYRNRWTHGGKADFRRGFIEGKVAGSADWFLKHAVALLEAEPVLTRFHLDTCLERVAAIAQSPALAEIAHLSLASMAGEDVAPLRGATFPKLESLELLYACGGFPKGGLAPIFDAAWIRPLKRLAMVNMQVDLSVAEAISTARLPHLESLDVGSNGANADVIERVCRADVIPQLSELSLVGNQGVDAAIHHLLAEPLPNMRRLQLGGTSAIHEAGFLVERRDYLPAIEILDLRGQQEGDRIPPDRMKLVAQLKEAYGHRVLMGDY